MKQLIFVGCILVSTFLFSQINTSKILALKPLAKAEHIRSLITAQRSPGTTAENPGH